MTIRAVITAAMLAALAPTASAAPAAKSMPLRRYALVIGSNNGGGTREQLRYAGKDARTIADVLHQLGGVNPPDLSLLSEPDLASVDRAFDALAARARDERQHGQRIELVVYYSGHSDETGILVGGAHYDYAKLRQRIRDVPADVRIAIVDSCASGSFTRMKGGARTPPFLRDSSNQVQGFAFLSSSSDDEDAQESDRIGASFFTYYFVAGLRGAADRNRDGKITLTEAYQFAYEETLRRTQNTAHGPQHAAYDMHLSGTGDVVITDLRSTEATLVLAPALAGRVTVLDKAGRVAVELSKDAGDPLSLALPNATYDVHVTSDGREQVATVTLERGGELAFDDRALRPVVAEPTVARGVSRRLERREHNDGWLHDIDAGFGGGLRVDSPVKTLQPGLEKPNFDALVTFGGTSRGIHGSPVVGVANTAEFGLGFTLGDKSHFAYDMSLGVGPGVYLGDTLHLGATIGFGFSGITGGVLDFAWKVPTEVFATLELTREIRPMAYFRQSYLFSSDKRQNGSTMARWGDEAEAGAGVLFRGKLDGFFYGAVREMAGVRYWGLGLGAIL